LQVAKTKGALGAGAAVVLSMFDAVEDIPLMQISKG
jgi:hypothetical protein